MRSFSAPVVLPSLSASVLQATRGVGTEQLKEWGQPKLNVRSLLVAAVFVLGPASKPKLTQFKTIIDSSKCNKVCTSCPTLT